MKRESNHMDEWLKGSAEMGNIPFNEGHWQHMQDLLRKPRKRRFIVWWWLLLVLLCGGAGTWLLVNKHEEPSNTLANASSSNNIKKIQTADLEDKKFNNTPLADLTKEISNDSSRQGGNSTGRNVGQDKAGSKISIRSGEAGMDAAEPQNKTGETGGLYKPKTNNKNSTSTKANANATVIPGRTETMLTLDGSEPADKINSLDKDPEEKLIQTNEPVDSKDTPATIYTNTKDRAANELIKTSDTTATLVNNKADSSSPRKTITKKSKRKPQLFLSATFSNGTIPVKSKSIGGELLFSIPIGKKFSLNPSISAAKIRINEQQIHDKVKSITSFPGTTFILVDKKTTVFSPANGMMAAAGITIGYKAGKWQFSSGVQRGIIYNKDNRIEKVTDTFYTYTTATLPAGLRVGGGNYNAADFNGKQFLAASIGVRYHFGRFHSGFNFNQQLWNNKVEGVTTGNKKRTAFKLLLGIRI